MDRAWIEVIDIVTKLLYQIDTKRKLWSLNVTT